MKFRMATIPLGGAADFRILRGGRQETLRVAAIAPPDVPPRQETALTGSHPLSGATVSNINPAVAVETGIGSEEGVVVTKVARRAPAARIVTDGDIIVSLNGHEVKTVRALEKELRQPARVWSFILSRDGRQRQVVLR